MAVLNSLGVENIEDDDIGCFKVMVGLEAIIFGAPLPETEEKIEAREEHLHVEKEKREKEERERKEQREREWREREERSHQQREQRQRELMKRSEREIREKQTHHCSSNW